MILLWCPMFKEQTKQPQENTLPLQLKMYVSFNWWFKLCFYFTLHLLYYRPLQLHPGHKVEAQHTTLCPFIKVWLDSNCCQNKNFQHNPHLVCTSGNICRRVVWYSGAWTSCIRVLSHELRFGMVRRWIAPLCACHEYLNYRWETGRARLAPSRGEKSLNYLFAPNYTYRPASRMDFSWTW